MVNCSYCGKELKRFVFCGGSCKTLYHRKGGPKETVEKVSRGFEDNVIGIEPMKPIEFKEIVPLATCKHGAAKGMCKYGC